MIELKIGMATEDGSLRVLDADRLCYQVLSQTHSARGVRTISKTLLEEWVEAVKNHPEHGAGELRSMLCGKTEVDKFEYGYFATLKKMADMALGRINVVLSEPDFSEEFVNWFAEHRGKGKKSTAEKYLGYFRTITAPYHEPTNSYWHGLYKVVYGKDAEKKVVAIGTLEKFDQVYGDLIVALEKKVKGDGMDDVGFQNAIDWFWKPEVKSHTCVTSALNAYHDFLEWRGKQPEADPVDDPSNVDRLTIVLKLFAGERKVSSSSEVHYWIFSPGERACRWDEMREGGYAALSYEGTDDLRKYIDENGLREEFKNSAEDSASHKNDLRALTDFLNVMKPGDYIFAKNGTKTFLGVGRVTGEYEFVADALDYKHRRKVEWFKIETVEREDQVARKTLTDVTRSGDLVRELCEAYGVEESTNLDRPDCVCRMVCEVDSKYDEYARQTRKMFGDIDGAKLVAMDWNEFCNNHFNGSQSVTHFRGYDNAAKEEFGDWIKSVREDSHDISHELDRVPKLDGLGSFGTTLCMFLMKANPKSFCTYAEQGFGSLVFLGLETGNALPRFSVENYYHHKELQSRVLVAMAKNEIGSEDGGEADYLTVNEFLWWVDDHKDLIKEKVMAATYKKTEIKKVEQQKIGDFSDFIKKLEDDVASVGLKYAPDLMKRFVCAQLAKPFVVLTGLSGSGKTKLAEAFTKWIGVENTVNVVPVGADWTNNEKLLGYPNALDPAKYVMPDTGVLKLMLDANENPDLPFFLILDEMNLSHVERYFADFLSTMESNDGIIELYDSGKRFAEDGREIPPSFKFPKNLFVIGTMNVDETTYMFSPKVLDRAQVIEFRVSEKEMSDFLGAPGNPKIDDLAGKGAAYAKAFLDLAAERKTKDIGADEKKKFNELLIGKVDPKTKEHDGLFTALSKLGAEFGYRSAIEMVVFIAYYLEASAYGGLKQSVDKEMCLKDAIDAAVLQKLLPKLHGSLNRLGPVLDALIGKVTIKKTDQNGDSETTLIYPLTYEKLQRMKDRVEKNGFTSFAEA